MGGDLTMAHTKETSTGARLFYVVAVMSTLISINTSWRFFGDRLHITDTVERSAMFAVLEMALVACACAMRARVRNGDGPGAPRTVAWLLMGLSAYMAIIESGPLEGIARVALGPALGLVSLHLALGIEIRRVRPELSGVLGRVAHELRERVLSRLGLADDRRDAATRTRHRAARRAARLASSSRRTWRRNARLAKALRVAGVAHDPEARRRMLAELAVLQHAHGLVDLALPDPWKPSATSTAGRDGSTPKQPATQGTPRSASPAPVDELEARRKRERDRKRAQRARKRLEATAR